MKTGTKSVLFGVHQFLWHPWTVAQSWRLLYGRWPNWWEAITIFCHDLGYVGCEKMDDEKGQLHPVAGAEMAAKLVKWISVAYVYTRFPLRALFDEGFQMQAWMAISDTERAARKLALGHSRYFCKKSGAELSSLFRADKLCTRFDPLRFYVFRARLSGEIFEYVARSPLGYVTPEYWASWYYHKVEESYA